MISICRIRCAVNLYYGARFPIALFRLLSSKSPTFESVLSREGLYKNVQLPEGIFNYSIYIPIQKVYHDIPIKDPQTAC